MTCSSNSSDFGALNHCRLSPSYPTIASSCTRYGSFSINSRTATWFAEFVPRNFRESRRVCLRSLWVSNRNRLSFSPTGYWLLALTADAASDMAMDQKVVFLKIGGLKKTIGGCPRSMKGGRCRRIMCCLDWGIYTMDVSVSWVKRGDKLMTLFWLNIWTIVLFMNISRLQIASMKIQGLLDESKVTRE